MNTKILKNIILLTLVFFFLIGVIPDLAAQCPMCRMSVESNLKNGGTDGQGLNNGILYMLATPYLLALGIGYFWWRNRKKEEDIV